MKIKFIGRVALISACCALMTANVFADGIISGLEEPIAMVGILIAVPNLALWLPEQVYDK